MFALDFAGLAILQSLHPPKQTIPQVLLTITFPTLIRVSLRLALVRPMPHLIHQSLIPETQILHLQEMRPSRSTTWSAMALSEGQRGHQWCSK